jgi:hypothetical protein
MKNKKFIVVQDKNVADKLKINGFQLISENNGVCTFMNVIPAHFNFSEVDAKKIAYTDILSI